MNILCRFIFCLILFLSFASGKDKLSRKKRATVGAAIGNRGSPPKRKPPPNVVPPLPLGPGETPEREPGWKCVKNMRANLIWKTFKSPGYPKFEESQIQCTWIIEAPVGMKVKLAYRDLDLHGFKDACGKQFVQLIDSKIGKSQGRFCGQTVPNDYVSSGNLLRLDLQGDKTLKTYRGFSANVVAVKEISGFRKTRTFGPPPGSTAPGGKVNLQQFSSQNEPLTTPSMRGNRKLVYESDLPKTTTTEAPAGNAAVPTDESGWLAQGGIANANHQGFVPAPTRNPALVPVGNRNNPPRQQSTDSSSSVKFVPTIKKPPSQTIEEVAQQDEGGYIDPSIFESSFDTHIVIPSDEKDGLSITTLVIIVASCVGAVILLLMFLGIWWLRRKRSHKEKSKKPQNNNESSHITQNTSESIRLKEIEARQSALPGMVQMNPHQPPQRNMSRRTMEFRPVSYMPPPGPVPQIQEDMRMPPSQMHRHIGLQQTESHMSSQKYQHYQRAEDFGRQHSLNRENQTSQMQRTRSGRTLPPVPNHSVSKIEATGYHSDSNDGVGAKTMRREYSAWELEKIKSDRRSKLIGS